ncbi:hypothetical protein WJX73_003090 [Symbiochloris irregularis]|uniref:Uncharacterized protein n=1 Tax=Symbiochloris irregularis TaxID=706552 RepID=A0AAW1NFI7_9CHLO
MEYLDKDLHQRYLMSATVNVLENRAAGQLQADLVQTDMVSAEDSPDFRRKLAGDALRTLMHRTEPEFTWDHFMHA